MASMALKSSISLLHRVSSIVSSDRSLDEMLGEIIGMTVQATECDACLVYLIDHEANEMVLRASQVPHAADLGELRIKMGEGVTGWVAEHRSVVALPRTLRPIPDSNGFRRWSRTPTKPSSRSRSSRAATPS